MNLSRRNLLLGAVATAVAPALPTVAEEAAATWIPQPPMSLPGTEYVGEIFYGGARGGGKMFRQMSTETLRQWFADYTTFGRAVTRTDREGNVTVEDPFIIFDEESEISPEMFEAVNQHA